MSSTRAKLKNKPLKIVLNGFIKRRKVTSLIDLEGKISELADTLDEFLRKRRRMFLRRYQVDLNLIRLRKRVNFFYNDKLSLVILFILQGSGYQLTILA